MDLEKDNSKCKCPNCNSDNIVTDFPHPSHRFEGIKLFALSKKQIEGNFDDKNMIRIMYSQLERSILGDKCLNLFEGRGKGQNSDFCMFGKGY